MLAAALRVAVLSQAAAGPPAVLHRWTESDMNFFDAWARVVAAGDLLTDRSLHPSHGWHREAAQQYLAAHPDEASAWAERAAAASASAAGTGAAGQGAGTPSPRDATALLLDEWWGGKRFHQEPLYPYTLAAGYLVTGGSILAVFVLQSLLGLLSVALVHRVTRQAFGDRPALWAGLLAVSCGPLLFYEVVLLRASLMACATLVLVTLAQRACVAPTAGRFALLGLAGGLATLLKTTFAPFVVLAGAWLLLRRRPAGLRGGATASGSARVACGLALASGFALALSPAVVRNVVVGAPPLSLQSVGPMSFVAFNSAHAGTDPTGFFVSTADIAEVFGVTGGESGATLRETLARAGGWTSLLPRMAARAWHLTHAYEAPQNVNIVFFRQLVPALGWAWVGFGVAAPLAAFGVVLAHRRRRGALPALMAASTVLPLILFSTLARYRLPLLVMLLPFAGLTLAACVCWARERSWRPLAAALVVVGGVALVVNRPLPAFAPTIRLDDHVSVFQADFRPRLAAASEAGDWTTALAVAEELLALEPVELQALDAGHPPGSSSLAALARHFAQLHRLTANIALEAGQDLRAGRALVAEGRLRASLEAP